MNLHALQKNFPGQFTPRTLLAIFILIFCILLFLPGASLIGNSIYLSVSRGYPNSMTWGMLFSGFLFLFIAYSLSFMALGLWKPEKFSTSSYQLLMIKKRYDDGEFNPASVPIPENISIDYTKYSLFELDSILEGINPEKYPDNYLSLLGEINTRVVRLIQNGVYSDPDKWSADQYGR